LILQEGAEALVEIDVEQDSPYFDFQENPQKCRTAGKDKVEMSHKTISKQQEYCVKGMSIKDILN